MFAPSFEVAARRLGHDIDTTTGAECARHDPNVWDLVGSENADE